MSELLLLSKLLGTLVMGPLLLALGVIAVRMTTGLSFRESFRVFMTCLEDMMYEMVSMFTGLFDGPDDDQQNPA